MNLADLTPSTVYVLCSAVRGLDILEHAQGRVLKKHVTRRIRGILFTDKECPGAFIDKPMTDDEFQEIKECLSQVPNEDAHLLHHFMEHLYMAVHCTQSHTIWGGLGLSLEAAFRDYVLER